MTVFRIGTAAWSVPTALKDLFPEGGVHLARYARRFNAVEINSSFYRPHRLQTYTRWASTVDESFRFAVKIPKTITHEKRLTRVEGDLESFLSGIAGLGPRLGPLLMQLPPRLGFDRPAVSDFLTCLRGRFAGPVVCEPRHPGWFTPAAEALLAEMDIARVAADPAPVPAAAFPIVAGGVAYVRLHGTPEMYVSAYSGAYLDALTERLTGIAAPQVWCVFDNTALGAAAENALDLVQRMRRALIEDR